MTGSYFYNKIIIVLALVAFLVGGFYPLNAAFSATTTQSFSQTLSNITSNNPYLTGATALVTGGLAAPLIYGGTQINQAITPPTIKQENSEISCILFSPLSGGTIAGCVAQLSFLILQLAAWVLWLSAIIFNESLKYSLNMAEFIKDIPIVALGWTTLRDVMNLMFVFIILYIGINTIIGNAGYGYKKLLGKVILGAMFINFSLFFTQAMIDVSNIFALQFYNKITQETKAQNSKSGAEANNYDKDSGISAAFVNAMGLQNIWSLGSKTQSSGANQTVDINNIGESKLGLNAKNLIVVGLGGTVLILVTAFVFFAATIMFLVRTVVLIFLMILSPVAFMGSILPALSSVSSDWWKRLMNNLIFAPAYMMLLYIVVSMITSNSFKGVGGKAGNFADMFAGGTNWTGTAITFAVLIMLMLGCLMIASNFGAIGAKAFEKAGFGMAKTLGIGLSGVGIARGLGSGIARGGLGVAGNAGISAGRVLSTTGLGRVFGGSALLRGGAALKDTKIGGKSYKDSQKAKEERIMADYELMKETDTSRYANIVRRSGESDSDFKARQAEASAKGKAIEKKNKERADKRVGISVDSSGKITKSHFGAPKIFGSAGARYKAQKALAKKRGGDDVNDDLKKPYEDQIEAAKQMQKSILAQPAVLDANGNTISPTDARHPQNQTWRDQQVIIKNASRNIKDIIGAFTPPKT